MANGLWSHDNELTNGKFRASSFGKLWAVLCKVKWQMAQIFRQLHGKRCGFGGGFLATGVDFLSKNLFVIFAKHSSLPLFGKNLPTKKTLGLSFGVSRGCPLVSVTVALWCMVCSLWLGFFCVDALSFCPSWGLACFLWPGLWSCWLVSMGLVPLGCCPCVLFWGVSWLVAPLLEKNNK